MSTTGSAPAISSRHTELGRLLRTWRQRLQPQDVGLPQRPRRRTPGLRREEVALLASVSTTYYIYLEQGREVNPSHEVLEGLARALHLSEAERAHLYLLARGTQPPALAPDQETPLPQAARLLSAMDALPVYLTGRRWDVLAANRMARALFRNWGTAPRAKANLLWWMFAAPESRDVLVNWEQEARALLARSRTAAVKYGEDPAFQTLVEQLYAASEQFRVWWPDQEILGRTSGTKLLHHPITGRIALDHVVLSFAEAPEQQLVVYSPQPGSSDETRLQALAEWAGIRSPETIA